MITTVMKGLMVLVCAANLASSAMAAPSAKPPTATSESAEAAVLISRFRQENGLKAVASDPQLLDAARTQADAMARAGIMSHDVAGGFSTRIRQAGIRAGAASENVAMGQTSLQEVIASWKASPGHRTNMLSSTATRIGLARAKGANGRLYWALILAAPEPQAGRSQDNGAGPFRWGPAPPWGGLFGR